MPRTPWAAPFAPAPFPLPTRIAGCLSLLSFAACLLAGGLGGGASFDAVVGRALYALAFSFVLGLIIGTMAQKMLDESLTAEAARLEEARAAKLKEYQEREPVLVVGSGEPTVDRRPARKAA